MKYIILYCYPFPQSFSRDPVAVRIGQEFHLRCAVQGVQNPVFRVIKDEKYCLQQSLSDRFVYAYDVRKDYNISSPIMIHKKIDISKFYFLGT